MGDERREQVAAARAIARRVNEQIVRVAQRFESDEGEFLCECGHHQCSVRVKLTLDEYERVRRESGRFFVVVGHQLESDDRVVEETERYVVAERPFAAA